MGEMMGKAINKAISKTRTWQQAWFQIGLAIPCIALALFWVWLRQDVIQLGYALKAAEDRQASLQKSLTELEVAYQSQRSTAHLKEVAYRMGMAAPKADQIVAFTPYDPNRPAHAAAHMHRDDRVFKRARR